MDALSGLHFVFLLHLFRSAAHVLAVHVDVYALHLHLLSELVVHLLGFVGDHDLRDIDGVELAELFEGCVLCCVLVDLVVGLLGLREYVCLKLVQGVELAYILGELIVKLRKLFLLDALDGALEDRFFSGQVLGMIFLRECYDYVLFLALLCAYQLGLEARNECCGTEL